MNSSTFVLRRLKKWRSDRVLAWVFPSVNKYTVVTWRRVNPHYNMSKGVGGNNDFDCINEFQVVNRTYCRTKTGAIFVQLLMGREQWTDGFHEQVVIISNPGCPELTPANFHFNFDVTPEFRPGKLDVTIDDDVIGTRFNTDGSVDIIKQSELRPGINKVSKDSI